MILRRQRASPLFSTKPEMRGRQVGALQSQILRLGMELPLSMDQLPSQILLL